MTKIALLALAAALSATAAQAGDVKPFAAQKVEIEGAAGNVYYTKEAEGFRVVATISGTEGAKPIRFVAMLADGQSMTVSVPVEIGKPAKEIAIVRTGDRLTVDDIEPLMVRASLD